MLVRVASAFEGQIKKSLIMFKLSMVWEIILSLSAILTMITAILYTFMFRLNMCLKMTLLYSFIVTLITNILYTFIFRNLQLHLNSIGARDKSLANKLMDDITFLQWASTFQETFHQNFELLEKKYENVEELEGFF